MHVSIEGLYWKLGILPKFWPDDIWILNWPHLHAPAHSDSRKEEGKRHLLSACLTSVVVWTSQWALYHSFSQSSHLRRGLSLVWLSLISSTLWVQDSIHQRKPNLPSHGSTDSAQTWSSHRPAFMVKFHPVGLPGPWLSLSLSLSSLFSLLSLPLSLFPSPLLNLHQSLYFLLGLVYFCFSWSHSDFFPD
jgi:hypothetical protein